MNEIIIRQQFPIWFKYKAILFIFRWDKNRQILLGIDILLTIVSYIFTKSILIFLLVNSIFLIMVIGLSFTQHLRKLIFPDKHTITIDKNVIKVYFKQGPVIITWKDLSKVIETSSIIIMISNSYIILFKKNELQVEEYIYLQQWMHRYKFIQSMR